MSEKIQSIGTLWKKENLASLESEIVFSELLLEDKDPLPGYYDHFAIPSQEKNMIPNWIFAVLKSFKSCEDDNFIRTTQKIRQSYKHIFSAAGGQLTISNELVPCIRFQINDFKQLPELLKLYAKHGIAFAPNRKVAEYTSLIKISKYFDLEPMAEHIYHDNDLSDMYYIEIPKGMDWNTFEQIARVVKNNCEHKVYDAALASVYNKSGVVDLVRIYDRHTNIDILKDIRDKFIKESERLL
ncbi:MAG: hypothetical protein U1C46_07115 [Bacteroidales bacterium]|nr:hypothetical protein [Bacteroidales bacterium]MDZ4204572.1 hypothetical protein [Bacteroidales bacterium]